MTLTADQLQYTSCRRGVRGGKGFQTRATTTGILPDEQREIEARGGYSVQRNLPPTPTQEEIDRDFPVAFRYYKLGSGRLAITRTEYTGKDYSQRWGNFFAHSLVVAALPATAWPIDYYEWSGWKGRLEPEEDTEEVPAPIGEVEFEAIEPSPSFSLAELQAFLKEAPGRTEILAAMIRAVFFGPQKSRTLVIRDTPLNGVFWLACVQKAFPPRHAHSLSVSTYQYDSRNCAMLNATTQGTDFFFDDTQRRFQFCMFDLLEGRSSEIPDDGSEYASAVATWMVGSPDRLQAFHAFMSPVERTLIDADMVKPLRLFRLASGDLASLPTEQLAEAIDFMGRHVGMERRLTIVPPLMRVAAAAAANGLKEQLGVLLRFLGESATGLDLAYRKQLAVLWTTCFRQLREGDHLDALPMLSEGRQLFAASAPEIECEIAARLLTEDALREIGSWLSRLSLGSAHCIEVVLRELLHAAETLKRQPTWAYSTAMRRLIDDACIVARKDRASALALLRAFDSEAEGIAFACEALVYGGPDPDEPEVDRRGVVAGRALVDLFAAGPDTVRSATRRALDKPERWPILLGEWRSLVEPRQSLPALYLRYQAKLAKETPAFDHEHREQVALAFAEALDSRERARQAATWLTTGEIKLFTPKMREWCIQAAAATIPLSRDDPTSLDLAKKIADYARVERVKVDPDRPALRELIEHVREPTVTVTQLRMDDVGTLLASLPSADYGAFLESFLLPALQRVRSEAEHGQILRGTFVANQQDLFHTACVRALSGQGKPVLETTAVEAALLFWLDGRSPGRSLGQDLIASLRKPVIEGLTTRLVAMERMEFEALAARLDAKCRPNTTAFSTWSGMRDSVIEQNRSMLNRFASIFQR